MAGAWVAAHPNMTIVTALIVIGLAALCLDRTLNTHSSGVGRFQVCELRAAT
jgi:hypothetical protein